MKIEAAPFDVLARVQEAAARAGADRVSAATVADATQLNAVEQHVVSALRGDFEDALAIREAVAESLISSQLRGMPNALDVGELAKGLLVDDPVFAGLVDQTILLTARALLEL